MAEERKYQVTIIDRVPVTTFPKLNVPKTTIYVTYFTEGLSPGTVVIDPEEIGIKDVEKLLEQIKAKKGSLYKKYIEYEKKRVREDIERRLGLTPESYEV